MTFDTDSIRSWPGVAGAVIVACLIGFGIARWTTPASAPAAPAEMSESRANAVAVTQQGLAAMGIATEAVGPGNLSAEVIAPATVDPEIRGEAVLMAHVAGSVSSITGRVGDVVKAGDVLAVVESRDAAGIAAARTSAEANLVLNRAALAREKELFAKQVVPREELERAQAEFDAAQAEAQQARTAAAVSHVRADGSGVMIVSPLSGTVVARVATLGLFVQPETELFRVANPRDIDIDVAIPASDAPRISAGDRAKARTRTGILVNAVVRSVTPTLNDETRAATAVLDPLPNQPSVMLGDLLTAEIIPKKTISNGMVVPAEAVQTLDGRDIVFVRTAKGFDARPVTVGARSAGHAAIVSGLRTGETIATTNAFFLKAELRKPTGEDE
ncbi:MAG TPA: efflux RND transporter periplasmic adaptor subunit [Rhizomicrobium sp.]|nr:efflux RND transporter periplasmic adaptor subunit [Rhizomicrobium sp.]